MGNYSSDCRFKDLDAIFFDGDILDTYRDSKHPDMIIVLAAMGTMMEFCRRHGIKLRILEGTPGHDYKQPRNFLPLAEAYGPELDFKYIQTLDFEYMEDVNMHILYVPDEWAGSAAACKEQIIEMMETNGIEKFDIAHMHGMFDFQIPDIGDHPLKHDSEWFHSIVRGFINIGHDHVFKTSSRILVQGSFDRIAHGEEGKKGAIVCHICRDGENRFEFIENKNARIFKTITVKTRDLDKAIAQVAGVLDKLPLHSHVRISSSKTNPIFSVMEEFKKAHPSIKFKKHLDKKQEETEGRSVLEETVSLASTFVAPTLTSDTIVQQIIDNLEIELSPESLDSLKLELEALV